MLMACDCPGSPDIHDFRMSSGETEVLDPKEAVNRHMWGARLQNWQPLMPEDLKAKTQEDAELLPHADRIMKCFPELL